MTKVILVCSGQTDWDSNGRIQSLLDIPLNAEGYRQAKEVAEELSDMRMDAIYSGSLSRAYQTARIIAQPHKLKVKKLKAFDDIDYGIWQGVLLDEIKKKHRKSYSLWRARPLYSKPPKGEAIKDVQQRVIVHTEKLLARHRRQIFCLVSHPIINTVIKCHFLKQNLDKIWKMLPETGSWEILEA